MRPRAGWLDLTGVTELGAAAQAALLRLHRRCRLADVHLVLVGISRPAVNQPLRLSGLLPIFDVRPTFPAALRGLGGGAADPARTERERRSLA